MKTNNHPEDAGLTSGKNISFWTDTDSQFAKNPLQQNIETDVVIIGGGIAGLSIAYCLLNSGKNVVLVEDGTIGSGETGRTTAHLVTALDNRYYNLERIFGREKTKLIAESHVLAINFIEETIQNENIDCEFERVKGYLFKHPSDKNNSLKLELNAALNAGLEVKETDMVPGFHDNRKALCFLNQAQLHPMKYLHGLNKAIQKKGGMIFTGTKAEKIDHEGVTTSEGFRISAQHIVVATNSPVNNFITVHLKQSAYRTYVIGALLKKDSIPKSLWWDTGDFNCDTKVPPYHYVRIQAYNDQYELLISGGEDHPTGDTVGTSITEINRYKVLETWTRAHFPIGDVIYRWSGQILEPMDGIAFIGHNPGDFSNIYVVTGDSGNGMTHCSFAGLLITDLINGKENKFSELYNPKRFTLKESAPVFKQMMSEFFSYMKQMPNFNDTKELFTLKNGEGRIVDILEEKFGAYRDEKGMLYIVSAECTHLKCTLAWNNDELSWDCPCHGSRFTYEGKVLNGPANTDLPAYKVADEHLERKEFSEP